jgi:pentatricopeptide repeat protein
VAVALLILCHKWEHGGCLETVQQDAVMQYVVGLPQYWDMWNVGKGRNCSNYFQQMQQKGMQTNPVTSFLWVLNECASVVALEEGRQAHVQITWNGYDSHIFVSNSIIDIYAKWGSIDDAWRVFNNIPSCGVVSFNVMILAHMVEWGQDQNARELFQKNATGSCAAKPYHFCGGHRMHVPV